jgi:xanthine dehydrogenase accessory factor
MYARDVFPVLQQSLDAQRPVAYCRLVATAGSTPQKAGAVMLVFPNGDQVGTIGGGCVEAEVRRAALESLVSGRPRIISLTLDGDLGWSDGLICGGRATALIRPVQPGTHAAHYCRRLCDVQRVGQGTEVVVCDGQCAGLPEADSYLFDAQHVLVDCLAASPTVPAALRRQLPLLSPRPSACVVDGVAFLPWTPRCRLLIVGGGHVGQALADLAAPLEFDVWVVDDRAEFVTVERFPDASRRIAGEYDDVLPALDITPDTYCVIVTRGHAHDARALFHLAQRSARYVGMIGSRRKIRLIFDELICAGVCETALRQVYAPLGIDIGSRTVPEIAVSVCAELVAHRNLAGRVPGRPSPVDVARQ